MNIPHIIIGYGTVGRNTHSLFPNADIYDIDGNKVITHDRWSVGFVCVPTPLLNDTCDTSIVEGVIDWWSAYCDVLCIKSTVPPGFTRSYIDAGHNVVMSPEFFGSTQHANAVDYDFVILGGADRDADIVAELYKEHKPASFSIAITDSLTAELVKYAENAFLATKVTFFGEWARIVRHFGANVNKWRELLLLDPRIGRSHTFTYTNHPYYNSHCLNKDIPALIQAVETSPGGYTPRLLHTVHYLNSLWTKEYRE